MDTRNCGNCDYAINAINGRLCLLIRKYRDQNAICEKYQAKNNNN